MDQLARLLRTILVTFWAPDADAAPSDPLDEPPIAYLMGFLQSTLDAYPESPESFLMGRYDLSPLDVLLLWLSLTPQLDADAADWVARANDNVLRDTVDIELALRVLVRERSQQAAVWAALAPDAPLRRSGLLRLVPREHHRSNPMRHQLVPHEQVAAIFYRRRVISAAAAAMARVLVPEPALGELPLTQAARELATVVDRLAQRPPLAHAPALGPAGLGFPPGVLLALEGTPGSGRATQVRAVAAQLGMRVIEIDGGALASASGAKAVACWRASLFEAELYGDLVCVRDADRIVGSDATAAAGLAATLGRRRAAVVVCLQETTTVHPSFEPYLLWRGQLHTRAEGSVMAALWRAHLSPRLGDTGAVDVEALAGRLSLQPLQVRKASHLSYLLAPAGDVRDGEGRGGAPVLDTALVQRAGLAQVSKSIGNYATISEPSLSLDDIVLDQERRDQLVELITAAQNRRRVLYEWGLSGRIHRGTGIVALFDGEPGTGKTHAAEVVAAELGLNLVRINIASIVDKYIGETEKNLTRIFAEARPDLNVLLFDEADSLFSKRTSEMSRSTDRYSNMNINVLLQLIERYEGIAVLTTNLKQAIDKAFERRFTYKIHFQMPELEQREAIWRLLLPPETPTAEPIDYEELSYIELSGGDIKTAILLGAYASARAGGRITNASLIAAAERVASDAGRVVRRPTDF